MKYKEEDFVNKKFGTKLVLKLSTVKGAGDRRMWECLCDCGEIKLIPTHRIKSSKNKCNCHLGKPHDIMNKLLKSISRHAKDYNRENSLSKEYLNDLLKSQNYKCALSGLTLELDTYNREGKTNASLDRIDSSKGYIEGNVQWVHKDINRMKSNFEQKEFIYFCGLVYKNMERI